MPKHLYLLTHDLRMLDNPAFLRASQGDELTCLFCVDQRWFRPGLQQMPSMGAMRWQFLQGCLSSLATQLSKLGQTLHIAYGDTQQIVRQYLQLSTADTLVISRPFGWYEQRLLAAIQADHPNLVIEEIDSYTLFDSNQSEWLTEKLPKQYTPFKRIADEQLDVPAPLNKPTSLPPSGLKNASTPTLSLPHWLPKPVQNTSPYTGDEQAAQAKFERYLTRKLPSRYSATRNALSGEDFSSKLSGWLSMGVLSVRWVAHKLFDYEQQQEADLSCRALWHELLWREYFQWLALKIESKLYRFQGISKRKPLTSFYPQRFKQWCEGNTPYSLVNACMQELKHTGYLSNRGRQIAASALVNELACDWRYGAAWFEYQLVDYDAAINWGNWQYIAGVGVDPRGGRHFNLEKQTQQFDPNGEYQHQWLGRRDAQTESLTQAHALDHVDAADWPLSLKMNNHENQDPGKE